MLQCINLQAFGISKCVMNLDSLRPFQTEALLQGTDRLIYAYGLKFEKARELIILSHD